MGQRRSLCVVPFLCRVTRVVRHSCITCCVTCAVTRVVLHACCVLCVTCVVSRVSRVTSVACHVCVT